MPEKHMKGIEHALAHAQHTTAGEKRDLAWYLGIVAHGKGITLDNNPFTPAAVDQWQHWRQGWRHASENIPR